MLSFLTGPAESSRVRARAFPLRLSASAPGSGLNRHPPPPNNSFKPTPHRGVSHVLYATLARVRRPATGRLNSGVRPQMNIEFSHDKKSGILRLTYRRHVFIAAGLLFIAGGIASLTGPWWLPILEALLGKGGLPIDSDQHIPVGVILIFFGLGLLYYKHFHLDAQQKRLDSDRRAIQSINIDPGHIRQFLNDLVDDHSYRSRDQHYFHGFFNHFLLSEHNLQDATTKRLYDLYVKASMELEKFVTENFFIFPREQSSDENYRYCLAPHLNIDREMLIYCKEKTAEYRLLSTQLHHLVDQTREAFEKFIADVGLKGHLNRAVA